MIKDSYESPLNSRYASREMKYIFSPDKKFKTWRRLWVALAESEMELGLSVTPEQVAELKEHMDDINYDVAEAKEKEVRHDVMSHVYAYGVQCPNAKGIIHLGATSCYVGDNTDIIIMYEGLKLIKSKLLKVISLLRDFAMEYKDMPTLGFTHFQPAQLTTVGKRASLWLWELVMEALDKKICEKMGYDKVYPVSGQTYSRKLDYQMLSVLSGIAQSAYKFANDIRLLQHLKEVEEPFEKSQIGSSAMAYKRNPMRSERICSLARYVLVDALNPAITSSTQWFERTLDDSANKRISVAEAFLAVDAILNIYMNVAHGLVVYPKVIHSRVMSELPFMATENILMDAVKAGGDRQELHEKIRVHSMAAARVVKEEGGKNDLIERIVADPAFGLTMEDALAILKPENFTGRAANQVEELVANYVDPCLEKYGSGADEVEFTV